MEIKGVEEIIQRKYDELVKQVRTKVKALPKECMQGGEDSRFNDVWQEFGDQLQNQHSVFFSLYEDLVRTICEEVTNGLTVTEINQLWLVTEGYWHWTEDESPPVDEIREYVFEKTYSQVCSQAAEEAIEHEDADYRHGAEDGHS